VAIERPVAGQDAPRALYALSMCLGRWLQEQLFARRIVLVTGRLDANADKPIELHLDSADGTIEAAFVLIGLNR